MWSPVRIRPSRPSLSESYSGAVVNAPNQSRKHWSVWQVTLSGSLIFFVCTIAVLVLEDLGFGILRYLLFVTAGILVYLVIRGRTGYGEDHS